MPASKIIFDPEDYEFIKQYKEATGISMQRFVTVAIQKLRAELEADQYLKDLPHTKK